MGGTAAQFRLRQHRETRGWTQQDVADQLARLAWLRHRERVGVNADMIAKWERGVKGISGRYRALLCLLFDVDKVQLDVTSRSQPAVQQAPKGGGGALDATFGETADLLRQLGPAGAILEGKVFEVWRDQVMHRRELLKLMALAPSAVPLVNGGVEHELSRRGPDAARDLDQLAGRYQALYHSAPPAALLTPVVAHLDTVREVLRHSPNASVRRRLHANRARVATLAGRLSFFDLHDPMGARAFYNLALESAREAADQYQAAAALGHIAFIPAADHEFSASLDYLQGAEECLDHRPHGPISSWLAAVESEMHSNAGSHSAALSSIDRAREALTTQGLPEKLPWFDYYDETRLAGFAGYATLRAERFDESRGELVSALGHLPTTAVKQRAVFLTDLATAHLREGDLDEACRGACDAAEQLVHAGYATGFDRLREFRASVEPWRSALPVRILDEQLAAIA